MGTGEGSASCQAARGGGRRAPGPHVSARNYDRGAASPRIYRRLIITSHDNTHIRLELPDVE
jgi:hypothetical protein